MSYGLRMPKGTQRRERRPYQAEAAPFVDSEVAAQEIYKWGPGDLNPGLRLEGFRRRRVASLIGIRFSEDATAAERGSFIILPGELTNEIKECSHTRGEIPATGIV